MMLKTESQFLNFLSIVDIDDNSYRNQLSRDLAARFGDGDLFKHMMLTVILVNAIFTALQVDIEWVP